MTGTPNSGRFSGDQVPTKGEQSPPTRPSDLVGDHAIALWDQAIADLPHILRQCDFAILKLCCLAYQRACDAYANGDDKGGLAAARNYYLSSDKIGLNPNSRRIIKPVAVELEDTVDPFDAWLERGGLN